MNSNLSDTSGKSLYFNNRLIAQSQSVFSCMNHSLTTQVSNQPFFTHQSVLITVCMSGKLSVAKQVQTVLYMSRPLFLGTVVLACVASVSVQFGSKELQGDRWSDFLRSLLHGTETLAIQAKVVLTVNLVGSCPIKKMYQIITTLLCNEPIHPYSILSTTDKLRKILIK